MTLRMMRQSEMFSPKRRQMPSRASLTTGGGLLMVRTSTKCCFLMDFTAGEQEHGQLVSMVVGELRGEELLLVQVGCTGVDVVWLSKNRYTHREDRLNQRLD